MKNKFIKQAFNQEYGRLMQTLESLEKQAEEKGKNRILYFEREDFEKQNMNYAINDLEDEEEFNEEEFKDDLLRRYDGNEEIIYQGTAYCYLNTCSDDNWEEAIENGCRDMYEIARYYYDQNLSVVCDEVLEEIVPIAEELESKSKTKSI